MPSLAFTSSIDLARLPLRACWSDWRIDSATAERAELEPDGALPTLSSGLPASRASCELRMRDGSRSSVFLEVLGDAVLPAASPLSPRPSAPSAPDTLPGTVPELELRLGLLTALPAGTAIAAAAGGGDGVRTAIVGRSPKTLTLALRVSRLRTPMTMPF